MFKKKKDGSIESDAGFTVRVLGRAGLQYMEGSKIMLVDSEMLNNPKIGFVVASSSITHWNGFTQKIGQKERLRVLNNITEAFKFIGFKIKVIRNF